MIDDIVVRIRNRFPYPRYCDDGLLFNEAADEIEKLRNLLERVKQACLFDDDDVQIGVTEDAVIDSELFSDICKVLHLKIKDS